MLIEVLNVQVLEGEKYMGFDDFKSKICINFNLFEYPQKKVTKLKSALNKLVINILPLRDSENIFLVRDFRNTSNLNLNFTYNNIMCYYSEKEDALMVGVLYPDWSSGNEWGNISKDRFVNEQINFLLHFFSQYIYRSYQVNMIGAISLATGIPTDFRGRTLNRTQGEEASLKIEEFNTFIEERNSELNLKVLGYLRLINALDPFVNRSIFYFVKFLDLNRLDFIEEAITAADNMVCVILQSIKKRKNKPTQERKEMCNYVYDEIGLYDETDMHNLDRLYLLRCRFTAHPSKSKWWDFYEVFEADIKQIENSVRKLLILFLKYENNNRLVEAHPTMWSKWFMENCDIIYDAVWFHEIP